MNDKNNNEFFSTAWKLNTTFARVASLMTLGIWANFSKSTVLEKELNPDADLLDIALSHYGNIIDTTMQYTPDALSIIFSEAATLTMDSIVPFMGTLISGSLDFIISDP